MPLVRKKKRSVDDGVKSSRNPYCWLLGESGSGKSTLGRMVMRLADPDGGSIRFGGEEVATLRGAGLRAYRRRVQIVFQDPFASLNPRQKVGDAIARGPLIFGATRAEAEATTARLLRRVGLGTVLRLGEE